MTTEYTNMISAMNTAFAANVHNTNVCYHIYDENDPLAVAILAYSSRRSDLNINDLDAIISRAANRVSHGDTRFVEYCVNNDSDMWD